MLGLSVGSIRGRAMFLGPILLRAFRGSLSLKFLCRLMISRAGGIWRSLSVQTSPLFFFFYRGTRQDDNLSSTIHQIWNCESDGSAGDPRIPVSTPKLRPTSSSSSSGTKPTAGAPFTAMRFFQQTQTNQQQEDRKPQLFQQPHQQQGTLFQQGSQQIMPLHQRYSRKLCV